ncbi:uncharacterized protein LOC133710381 [Rosa rugosa]|uniref:uncharacterized protein LOC133710381 n=1 Tax=Rosa rugosa TaxID=74645 RepID=UPI002B407160|nr:uncharacterized protein LOC133710381 [Rosa rugosa]
MKFSKYQKLPSWIQINYNLIPRTTLPFDHLSFLCSSYFSGAYISDLESSGEKVVAVIMVGGPTKGTCVISISLNLVKVWIFLKLLWVFNFLGRDFQPLSINTQKPLFPLAGQAMVHHPISTCKKKDQDPNGKFRCCGCKTGEEGVWYWSKVFDTLMLQPW